LTERESVFDREVLTLDIAKVAEPTQQRLDEIGKTGRRKIPQTHDLCWLLRTRRELATRLRRRAA
jgi:hypothetical protein